MAHSFVTVAIPFNNARSDAVEAYLDSLGNPALASIGVPLDEAQFIHFMSINVIRGDAENKAHLVFELNADTGADSVLNRLENAVGKQVQTLLEVADITIGRKSLANFLGRYQQDVGQGWFSTPGLNYDGTPDMTVPRIRKEAELAKSIAAILDVTPPSSSALDTLEQVRSKLWTDNAMKWAFVAEPAPCLGGKPTWYLAVPQILVSAFTNLLWPFVLVPFVAFLLVWLHWRLHAAVWVVVLLVAAEIAIAGAAFWLLRRKENTDISDDIQPAADIVAEIMKRESHAAQNHLAASSTMKSGRLRRITLRIGFWAAGQIAVHASRPSYLGDTGVIHFARWILLPGTDKLLFMSNYDGAWESYLEDFIQIAFQGVTGIWSNTVGFPKTAYLFNKGAVDGDQLRPWTRRQQYPSRVWYTAYPDLTLTRIRTNAAIRQGLASASTEAEAADWLACFGSTPRPAPTIEYAEVPTLVLGGLRRLRFGKCLFLKLSPNTAKNKTWLKQIEPRVSYGDSLSASSALVIAFSQSGLRKLGLADHNIATFPVPFQHGNAAPWRARALGDTDASAPEHWKWGNSAHEADAVMLIYADDPQTLTELMASRTAELKKSAQTIAYEIEFEPLPEKKDAPIREPFGFVDGISNLSIRGVGRPVLENNRNQLVEPGEIILGYPDNSGYMPVSPTVASSDDPENILPARSPDPARLLLEPPRERPDFSTPQPTGQRDLGFNGTFLVVRQLEQDTEAFDAFLDVTAEALKKDARVPASQLKPTKDWKTPMQDWIAAKMVGRWKDGTSLVRHPHLPGTMRRKAEKPDNDFQLGADDPNGLRCPFGAHIRRANPRESFAPGSQLQLAITNRHRIHRIGRPYRPQNGLTKPGLVFMCLNADIERQFEFVQQTWVLGRSFHGLESEVDPIIANKSTPHCFTIPTADGPVRLKGLKDFVKVRGGGYFFLPGRKALQFLAH